MGGGVNWADFGYVRTPQGWQKAPGQWGAAPAAGGGAMGPLAPGVLGGAPPRGYTPAAGGIPQVTDTATSLKNLIAALGGNMGGVKDVVGGLTGASSEALRDQYPNEFFTGIGTGLENINRRLEGKISDLLPTINQEGAEWGIGRGVAGSPAYESKLARDVLGSAYNVQRNAQQDLAQMRNTIPTVAPFDVGRITPSYDVQSILQQWADTLGAAPVPEDVYRRNRADALSGLNRGFNAGFTPARSAGLGAVATPLPAIARGPQGAIPAVGAGGIIGRRDVPPWGQAWNNEGGFAQAGNVPAWAAAAVPQQVGGWDFDEIDDGGGWDFDEMDWFDEFG